MILQKKNQLCVLHFWFDIFWGEGEGGGGGGGGGGRPTPQSQVNK